MKTTTLNEFEEKILSSGRYPLRGSIELTFQCNLKCIFCYRPQSACIKKSEELTAKKWNSIIDEVTELGCLSLLITGGEPLLRNDFKEIYEHALENGLIVTLYSNGTLIDEDLADYLSQNIPHKIEISLYGLTKKTYELVTQVTNSYEKCMSGINLLMERNVPLVLKTTVCERNFHEVSMIREFSKNHGLKYKFDAMLDPQIDGNLSVCQYRLNPEQIIALDLEDPKRKENLKHLKIGKNIEVDTSSLYICGAGESSFHIDPYGYLSMCMMTRYSSYDLKLGSFKKVFYEDFLKLRSQKHDSDKIPKCNICPLIYLCTNCPGTSYLETGSFINPSKFHCQVAQLRAKIL